MTRRRFVIRVEEQPAEADVKEIHARLRAFNEQQTGRPVNPRPFSVFIRDGDGAIVGGLNAFMYWDWLGIDQIWVDEGLRRHGWGRRLLEAAERAGLEGGCRAAFLDTFSFQAPGFYRRMGYQEVGVSEDHPTGERRHFFWKPLRSQPRSGRRTPARRR